MVSLSYVDEDYAVPLEQEREMWMRGRLSNIRTATALVTPFDGDEIDPAGLMAAIDRQVLAGMDAVIVCDMTGEGYSLTDAERDIVLSTCLEQGGGRLAVIAATGTYSTARSIALTRRAQQLGADGLLVTVPYYSKPTKAGVANHFRSIADATHLPIIIDDDPQRTVIEGGATLLSALMDVENIVGIRHGAGRLSVFAHLDPVLRRRYHHYCGDELDVPAFLGCGGHGVVSSAGNLEPFLLAAMGRGLPGASARFGQQMAALLLATGGQWDASVIKAAGAILWGSADAVRLPLVGIGVEMRDALQRVLASHETAVEECRSPVVA